MSGPDRLAELLGALFEREPELRRFLAAAGFAEAEYRLPVTKGESLRGTAAAAAMVLDDMGMVGPPLFEALAQRSPDRAEDVWAVAAELGALPTAAAEPPPYVAGAEPPEAEPPPPAPAGPPLSDAYAEFAAGLAADFAADPSPDPAAAALDPERWPWTGAAAVLGGFRPRELRPLPGSPPPDPAQVALADVVFTTAEGRWVLEDAVRAAALARLAAEQALPAAVAANPGIDDVHRDWIRTLLTPDDLPRLATLDTRDLAALDTVTRWLEPHVPWVEERRPEIYAATERRALIDPLRRLVGAHFRGRATELAALHAHLYAPAGDPLLVLTGPGGSGKSTLLGKLLLELEDRIGEGAVPFAYVDFDKARHDPRDPRGLLEQIARQLRLLYAANADLGRTFAAVEAASAGTDIGLASELLELDTAQLDVDGLIRELAGRLQQIAGGVAGPRLILFLDTFEEVQLQGPGAVQDVVDLMRRFAAALPGLRLVVSGRGELRAPGVDPERTLRLGDLDPVAADAVLAGLGVDAAEIRALIFERFGGNPLVLHLAAEALRRLHTAERAFDGVLGRADAVAAIGLEQVQGMLYDRILGHIGDPEIVKIAHPGLAVRRVDPDVIRDVLAGPCGIDPAHAGSIFGRLQVEVSMFEPDPDGALRHRQDVRRLMLRAMLGEPEVAAVVVRIHPLAVAFYAARPGPVARAEELYHRLMGGEDPRSLDGLWDPGLRESLAPALEDPLPAAAATWLRRRLGLIDAEAERATWEQEDWEAEAADRVRSWLASGDAATALAVLRERATRLPGSPLFALETGALVDLGQLDAAAAVLERGMQSALDAGATAEQLTLAEQAVRIARARKDPAGIVAATESAVSLGDAAGDPVRCLDELAGSVAALHELGATAEAERLAGAVSRRFAALPAASLRDNAELVRSVVASVGATDSTVLAQAASTLGDVSADSGLGVFREDAFALSRILESTAPEGRAAMNELAAEVGLQADTWTPLDLATSAVKFGRTGKAVVVALDHAAQEDTTRRMIVDQLTQPVVR